MDVSFLTLVDRGNYHLISEEDPRLEEESDMSDYFSYLDDIAALDAAIILIFFDSDSFGFVSVASFSDY